MEALRFDLWLIAIAGMLLGLAYFARGTISKMARDSRGFYFILMGLAAITAAIGVFICGVGLVPLNPELLNTGFEVIALGGLVMAVDYGISSVKNLEGKRLFHAATAVAALLASGVVLKFGMDIIAAVS
jgi:predicted membrane channel-forming protein YqfA (hemolysin III family)